MALRKILEIEGESFVQSEFGVVQTGIKKITFLATCKVLTVSGSKSKLNFLVLHAGEGETFERSYSFEPSVLEGSPNFIKQAYLFLKTLPEFAGAEDC